MPIALLVALFLGGGGAAFAAEGALPGDVLYPVKTSFNEKVVGVFSFSDKAKIEREVRLSERRLEEAEKLMVKGELTAENQKIIEARFEAHAEAAQTRIEAFSAANNRTDDAIEVSVDFEARLRAHDRVIEVLSSPLERREDGRVVVVVGDLNSTGGRRAVADNWSDLSGRKEIIDSNTVVINGTAVDCPRAEIGILNANGSLKVGNCARTNAEPVSPISGGQSVLVAPKVGGGVSVGAQVEARIASLSRARTAIEGRAAMNEVVSLSSITVQELANTSSVIAKLKEVIISTNGSISADLKAEVEGLVRISEDFVAEAKVKITANAHAEALKLLRTARNTAQEARQLLKIYGNLDIQVEVDSEVQGQIIHPIPFGEDVKRECSVSPEDTTRCAYPVIPTHTDCTSPSRGTQVAPDVKPVRHKEGASSTGSISYRSTQLDAVESSVDVKGEVAVTPFTPVEPTACGSSNSDAYMHLQRDSGRTSPVERNGSLRIDGGVQAR